MTACSGVSMPMHALRETCTRMGLRYQIVMGGVHVDLISCNFAKPAQAGQAGCMWESTNPVLLGRIEQLMQQNTF